MTLHGRNEALKAFKEEYCRQFPEVISVGTGSIYKI
jgi:Fe-S-cluster containining protein